MTAHATLLISICKLIYRACNHRKGAWGLGRRKGSRSDDAIKSLAANGPASAVCYSSAQCCCDALQCVPGALLLS